MSESDMTTHDKYFREEAAAKYVTLSKRTLGNYRRAGVGPKHFRVGKCVIYSAAALDEWLQDNATR